MTLDQIQPNLISLLTAMPVFAGASAQLFLDDGTHNKDMEDALLSVGLAVLVMPPQCLMVRSQGIGAASLDYSSTVWVRTNPKVQSGVPLAATWNPLVLEKAIIPAVLAFGEVPINYFRIPEHLEPETDFSDLGNNSRLIRFSTSIIL